MPAVKIDDLKKLLVENCMLKVNLDSISETTPLFGPNSVGLDSIDALQMTLAIEKSYGIQMTDAATAREALQSLAALRDWIGRQEPKSK